MAGFLVEKFVALLVFRIATSEIVFGRKKRSDAKGPFGDNVIKNPGETYMIKGKKNT